MKRCCLARDEGEKESKIEELLLLLLLLLMLLLQASA